MKIIVAALLVNLKGHSSENEPLYRTWGYADVLAVAAWLCASFLPLFLPQPLPPAAL